MKRTYRVNGKARVLTMRAELVERGFDGDVPGFEAGDVIVLCRPKASVEDITESLDVIMAELHLVKDKRRPL